jgi:hypothetical protein
MLTYILSILRTEGLRSLQIPLQRTGLESLHSNKQKTYLIKMVGVKVVRRKLKKHSISRPVESNQTSFVATDPPPSTSVPSLYSGSTDTSNEEPHSRPISRTTFSFASTAKFSRNSQCSADSCSSFGLSMKSPSKLPSQATLDEAGNVPIFDADGNSRQFKSLYSGNLAIGEQQMIIFVRHFFCGVRTYCKQDIFHANIQF